MRVPSLEDPLQSDPLAGPVPNGQSSHGTILKESHHHLRCPPVAPDSSPTGLSSSELSLLGLSVLRIQDPLPVVHFTYITPIITNRTLLFVLYPLRWPSNTVHRPHKVGPVTVVVGKTKRHTQECKENAGLHLHIHLSQIALRCFITALTSGLAFTEWAGLLKLELFAL